MENIYYTKVLVGDFEAGDLDHKLMKLYGFDWDTHDDFVETTMGRGDADGAPIAIGELLDIILGLQKSGATHVEMNYHEDHVSYEISGYVIRPSTTEEIKIKQTESLSRKEKEDQVAALYAEIRKIQQS